MATLSEPLLKFFATLSLEEQRKYWANYEEDVQTKMACYQAGLAWDQESESAALRYLRNLKKRKELANILCLETKNDAFEQKQLTATKQNLELSHASGSRQPSESNLSSRTPLSSRASSSVELIDVSNGEISADNLSDSENESEPAKPTADGDKESVYEDCVSVAVSDRQAEQVATVEPVVIKKFPESSFRKRYDCSSGGLFSHIGVGHIRGQLVKVKTFHFPMTGINPNCEKFEMIRKVFQLNYRNLIPLIGMIDVGIKDCPQLVYAFEENDISLLQYLRIKDASYPKGYATFGKFSLDIISACEYLHTNGVVHGCLSASSVVIRRAYGRHNGKYERKLHLNSFLGDYGVIRLTDCIPKGDFHKAANGKIVHLRWSPKELLEAGSIEATNGTDISYSFQSDVWSFGVLLWEMWALGNIPYGKGKSNAAVEKDILDDCNPLTFEKPSTCPHHILEVMKSIFMPVYERPSFLRLKQTFEEFRKYKYEHNKDENQTPTSKFSNDKKMQNDAASSSISTVHSRYQRVQEWKNQASSGNFRRPASRDNYSSNFCGNGKDGPKFTGTTGFKRNAGKPKRVPVYIPVLTSGGNDLMTVTSDSSSLLQRHLDAFAALNLATRQAQNHSMNSGSNSINVNIDSQRFGTNDGGGGASAKPANPRKNNNKKKKGGSSKNKNV